MLKSSFKPSKTARSDATTGTSNSKKKNHPFYISSLFDVFAQVSIILVYVYCNITALINLKQLESDIQGTWGFRHSHMTIVTREPDADESMEWVIKGSAYGGIEIILEVDGVYFLKGRLIALNQPGEQRFYYEPKNQIFATTSRDLKGDLLNSVSVFGLGVIISRDVEPVSAGKDTIVVVVRHTDYNPEICALSSFDVQYRCPWSPLMEKLQPLLIPNREVQLVSHIIGKDMSKHMWIVEDVDHGEKCRVSFHRVLPATSNVDCSVFRIFDENHLVQGSSKDLNLGLNVDEKPTESPKKRARATPVRNAVKTPNKKPKKANSPRGQNPTTVPEASKDGEGPTATQPSKGKAKAKAIPEVLSEEQSVADEESDED
ncbi:uncharacterized protein MELLADRAFT_59635 [Melampsora larici-populina 98AG31]|uniref:Uncharacterized protein n=1 Tax=Melampsora larici-populina (strain 98AG31 / pathotype 3-4-7) TaxID=747676 RepID=F4R889_MELLP|nr:uncharacterized protein MELLADRAFT_59635 [Melampsora larici-populina 98AG31]EGG11655.1 hypothetical protein MELLADRAFT_59635 [Melampsora larici-populina 98AG31]